ncbi:MAG: HesA/MoeB/ThiF family protein [Methanomassiliicoccales archaeon]|nr:MAG: HesA/MoeB/ThiF family protein [Methanomassiliicoccales archaeon]
MKEKLEENAQMRFARQLILPQIGEKGQRKLGASVVSICGIGGLGSPAAQYLVAAGVGEIRLIDKDPVEISNLNRQVLHWEEDCDASSPKVESAARKLRKMSSSTNVIVHNAEITDENVHELLIGSDVVVDCLDNYSTRFIVNRACLYHRIPLVHAAVEGWRGQATVVLAGATPCISCLVKRVPEVDRPTPIIGATAGVFGCIQAAEAIKLIVDADGALVGRLLIGDLLSMHFEVVDVERAPDCIVCGR